MVHSNMKSSIVSNFPPAHHTEAKPSCIFCGNDDPAVNYSIPSFPGELRWSGVTLISFLSKILKNSISRNFTPADTLCINCFHCLEQLDDLHVKAEQLQDILTKRFKERENINNFSMSSVIQSKVKELKKKNTSAKIGSLPGLTVAILSEPIVKKRSYSKDHEEFMKSYKYLKTNKCGPSKAESIIKTGELKNDNLEINENFVKLSTKCKVRDLDKSFLKFKTNSLSQINNQSDVNLKHSLSKDYSKLRLPHNLSVGNFHKSPKENSTYYGRSDIKKNEGELSANLPSQLQNIQHTADVSSVSNAQHLLLNNSFANTLLNSFLSTSLWMEKVEGEREVISDKENDEEKNSDSEGVVSASEDVTSESLSMPVVHDKMMRQELKNTGQSYMNTKGKMVEAKRVSPQDCSKCPMHCNSKLSDAERQSVFGEFWGLADYDKQREYLAAHMVRKEKLGPSGLTRTVVLYYLTHRRKIQVCRQFFLRTLDVSEKSTRIVLTKKMKGEFGKIDDSFAADKSKTRTTSSRSKRIVAINKDAELYEY